MADWKQDVYKEEYKKEVKRHKEETKERVSNRIKKRARTDATLRHGKTTAIIKGTKSTLKKLADAAERNKGMNLFEEIDRKFSRY